MTRYLKKQLLYERRESLPSYILECIQKIEEDIACGREIFMNSHLYQDAVLRNLQTLTESTQRISENLKEGYPEVNGKVLLLLGMFLSMIT